MNQHNKQIQKRKPRKARKGRKKETEKGMWSELDQKTGTEKESNLSKEHMKKLGLEKRRWQQSDSE